MHNLDINQFRKFVFGGNAIFTLVNNITNKRITYKVVLPKFEKESNNKKPMYFVKALTGVNNDSDSSYSYLGILLGNGTFKITKGTKIDKDAISMKGINYISHNYLLNNAPHKEMQLYHEGKCARCGRLLTVPESIESGFGPECIKMLK